jgi:Uracil DNA glycosylase superfamily.
MNVLTSKQIQQSEQLTEEYGTGRGPSKLVYLDDYTIYPDKFVVAVLDTMYDWRGKTSGAGYREAPRYFRINPNNFTGKRLYRMVGKNKLLVTDACRELVHSSKEHGTPDPVWLYENIVLLNKLRPIDILLICGRVAQKTFAEILNMVDDPRLNRIKVLEIPHPAARNWTNEKLDKITEEIRRDD